MANYTEDTLLDASGLLCPMPVVKAGKVIRKMEDGQILKIIATDRGAIADFPAWADDMGHKVTEQFEDSGEYHFILEKS